jgi:hypothetical protein
MKRTGLRAAVAASFAGAAIVACGGSSSSPFPEYRPDDFPPIKTVVLEASFELGPLESTRFDVRVPDSNPDWSFELFATIDWTDPSSNVVAAFGGESCGGVNLALAGTCDAGISFTEPSVCAVKPRVVTATASTRALVRLYVANAGETFESGRVQVVTCRDTPDCGEGAACGQCSLEKREIESCP